MPTPAAPIKVEGSTDSANCPVTPSAAGRSESTAGVKSLLSPLTLTTPAAVATTTTTAKSPSSKREHSSKDSSSKESNKPTTAAPASPTATSSSGAATTERGNKDNRTSTAETTHPKNSDKSTEKSTEKSVNKQKIKKSKERAVRYKADSVGMETQLEEGKEDGGEIVTLPVKQESSSTSTTTAATTVEQNTNILSQVDSRSESKKKAGLKLKERTDREGAGDTQSGGGDVVIKAEIPKSTTPVVTTPHSPPSTTTAPTATTTPQQPLAVGERDPFSDSEEEDAAPRKKAKSAPSPQKKPATVARSRSGDEEPTVPTTNTTTTPVKEEITISTKKSTNSSSGSLVEEGDEMVVEDSEKQEPTPTHSPRHISPERAKKPTAESTDTPPTIGQTPSTGIPPRRGGGGRGSRGGGRWANRHNNTSNPAYDTKHAMKLAEARIHPYIKAIQNIHAVREHFALKNVFSREADRMRAVNAVYYMSELQRSANEFVPPRDHSELSLFNHRLLMQQHTPTVISEQLLLPPTHDINQAVDLLDQHVDVLYNCLKSIREKQYMSEGECFLIMHLFFVICTDQCLFL